MEWIELIQAGGSVAVIAALIYHIRELKSGEIHTDREFQDERADKLEWKGIALEALKAAQSAATVAEKVSDAKAR